MQRWLGCRPLMLRPQKVIREYSSEGKNVIPLIKDRQTASTSPGMLELWGWVTEKLGRCPWAEASKGSSSR